MADGYFETLRTYGGRPALLGAHVDRLVEAAKAGDIANPPTRSEIAAVARTAVASAQGEDAMIRIELRPDGDSATLAAEALPLPPHALAGGAGLAAVVVAEVGGYAYPLKSTERSLHGPLIEAAEAVGADDAIVVDAGEVIEATRANVLILKEGRLITPPLGRCLPGVTRAALLEIAPPLGLAPVERELRAEELAEADEVLLSNALIEVRRVSQIDGQPVGGGDPGMHMRLLAALLAHYRDA